MPETTAEPRTQRRGDQVTQTTSTSLTAAGCAAFILWIFGMIDAGHFFVPPVETAMFMGASLLPIGQALGRRWIREINHDIGGVNGKAPANGSQSADSGATGK